MVVASQQDHGSCGGFGGSIRTLGRFYSQMLKPLQHTFLLQCCFSADMQRDFGARSHNYGLQGPFETVVLEPTGQERDAGPGEPEQREQPVPRG